LIAEIIAFLQYKQQIKKRAMVAQKANISRNAFDEMICLITIRRTFSLEAK